MTPMNPVPLTPALGLCACTRGVQTASPAPAQALTKASTFHALSALDIHGKTLSMQELKGKKVMVVNTASECGYTPQYEQLQELYEAYKDKGLVIIGFPCNQFGKQEPGDANEIKNFCSLTYDVTFPMFAKVDVNGKDAHPLFIWLKDEKKGLLGGKIKWNFTKFLVGRDGQVISRHAPTTKPEDLEADIRAALDAPTD